jgi:hypothetical protein
MGVEYIDDQAVALCDFVRHVPSLIKHAALPCLFRRDLYVSRQTETIPPLHPTWYFQYGARQYDAVQDKKVQQRTVLDIETRGRSLHVFGA